MRPLLAKFFALAVYAQPEFLVLKERFTRVDPSFKHVRIEPIECCQLISREPHEIEFEYVCLGRETSTDTALAELERREVLPAQYEELLAFIDKYPAEAAKHMFAALGSEANVYGGRYVVCVWKDQGGWHFDLQSVNGTWPDNCVFLAVKPQSAPTPSTN